MAPVTRCAFSTLSAIADAAEHGFARSPPLYVSGGRLDFLADLGFWQDIGARINFERGRWPAGASQMPGVHRNSTLHNPLVDAEPPGSATD